MIDVRQIHIINGCCPSLLPAGIQMLSSSKGQAGEGVVELTGASQ